MPTRNKRGAIKAALLVLAVASGAGLVASHEVFAKKAPPPPVLVATEGNVADFIYDPSSVPSWYYDATWTYDDKGNTNWINKEIDILQNLSNKDLQKLDDQVYHWNGHQTVSFDHLQFVVDHSSILYELLEDDANFQNMIQDFLPKIGIKAPRSSGGVGNGNGNGNGKGNGHGHGDNDDDHGHGHGDDDHGHD